MGGKSVSAGRAYRIIVPLMLLPLALIMASSAHAECRFYAGMGYRCFGDQGGTGGEAFKQMDRNTADCGFFDPGCKGKANGRTASSSSNSSSTSARSPAAATSRYTPPPVGPKYVAPHQGPGYVRPQNETSAAASSMR